MTRQPIVRASSASVRAAGPSPTTASSGPGSCGSTSTSTVPSDAQWLSAQTTSSPGPAAVPLGPMRTSRGVPSATARSASRTTTGSEHAPPTQPTSAPSAVTMRAVAPAGGRRPLHADDRREGERLACCGEPSGLDEHLLVPRPHSARPTSFSAAHTLSGVTGISRLRTPAYASASTIAFT